MTGKVKSEYYRIVTAAQVLENNINYGMDMYYKAYGYAAEKKECVTIERVTVIEREPSAADAFMSDISVKNGVVTEEIVTASASIQPPNYTVDILSRYSPVNGWVIPETIEI